MSDPDVSPVEDRSLVLAIGGLDPSGGAGILTDAAVIRAFGLHPLTVATGVAAQNRQRMGSRHDLPARVIREQLSILSEEFQVGAVKTGMIPSTEAVRTVSGWLAERPRLPLVLDPVQRSSSGGELAGPGTVDALVCHLFPRARVITPNLQEAGALTGRTLADRDQVPEAAKTLLAMGPEWVLVTGGHLKRGRAADYLAGPETGMWLEAERRPDGDVRGTGCALASALAAGLARGDSVPDAARGAKQWVTRAIDASYVAGSSRFLGFPDSVLP